jgi:citrate lyase subunit beta/citryl-CoA lyase
VRSARSHLYVPGDAPAKLARAGARGADSLIVDLEDAVAPMAKADARRTVAHWLAGRSEAGGDDTEVWVRINPSRPDGTPPVEDLEVAVHPAVTGVVAAKCESAEALAQLDRALGAAEERNGMTVGSLAVAALVETAVGILALPALAAAPRVVRLQIGEADLVASLGMTPGPDDAELLPLRLALVVASAAAGLEPPVGPVHTRLDDLEELRSSTEALRRLGFAGRAAIHPAQVAVINEVFTPTAGQEATARDLIDRLDRAVGEGRGVATAADGSLIDEAVVRPARTVVARAELARGRAGTPGGAR